MGDQQMKTKNSIDLNTTRSSESPRAGDGSTSAASDDGDLSPRASFFGAHSPEVRDSEARDGVGDLPAGLRPSNRLTGEIVRSSLRLTGSKQKQLVNNTSVGTPATVGRDIKVRHLL